MHDVRLDLFRNQPALPTLGPRKPLNQKSLRRCTTYTATTGNLHCDHWQPTPTTRRKPPADAATLLFHEVRVRGSAGAFTVFEGEAACRDGPGVARPRRGKYDEETGQGDR